MTRKLAVIAAAFTLGLCGAGAAFASDTQEIQLTIKDHLFHPDRVEVEAGKPFVLMVKNDDPTPEEFESHDLHLEKVIPGGSEAKIRVKALDAGEYKFVGEFNEDTAKGVIVAK